MKSRNVTISVLVLFFAGISAAVFANSFADTYGFSAEGMSRGNAMTAVVNDWSSVYYNVAGLGKTQSLSGETTTEGGEMTLKLRKTEGEPETKKEIYPSQFALGFLYTMPQLKLNIQRYVQNATTGDYTPVKTKAANIGNYGYITIGGALDLNTIVKMPDFVSSVRLGLGLGVNHDGSLTKVNDIDPRTHDFLRYGKEVQRAMILVGLGIGILKDSLGIGIGANISFHGKAKTFMETDLTANPQVPIAQSQMDLSAAPGAIAGVYFSPGKIWSAVEGLDFGASYRMSTKLKIDPFDAAASILGGIINMNLMLAVFDYWSPHIVTAGIAYSRWGVTLSLDGEYQMWSKYQVSKVLEQHYFGLPKMTDIIVARFGVKYDTPVSWLSIMAGYSYVPSILASVKSPFHKSNSSANTLNMRIAPLGNITTIGMYNWMDNNKHVASAGIKFTVPKLSSKIGGQIIICLGYQFQYLEPVSVQKPDLNYKAYPGSTTFDYLLNPGYSYGGMNHTVAIEVGMRL